MKGYGSDVRSSCVAIDIGDGFVKAATMRGRGYRVVVMPCRVIAGSRRRMGDAPSEYRLASGLFQVAGGPFQAGVGKEIVSGVSAEEATSLLCREALNRLRVVEAAAVLRLGRWSELGVGPMFRWDGSEAPAVARVGVVVGAIAGVFDVAREQGWPVGEAVVVDAGRGAIRIVDTSWDGETVKATMVAEIDGLGWVERDAFERGKIGVRDGKGRNDDPSEVWGALEFAERRWVWRDGNRRDWSALWELSMGAFFAEHGERLKAVMEGVTKPVVLIGGGAAIVGEWLRQHCGVPVVVGEASILAAARGAAVFGRDGLGGRA